MVKKRILFVFHVPFIPMNGGVERVTDILSRIFLKKGYEVFYLNNIRRNSDFVYPVKQFYFPDMNVYSASNINFYNRFIEDYNIDIVINQNGAEKYSYLYLDVNNKKTKVVSVIHTNPLAGYNYYHSALLPLWNGYSFNALITYFAKLFLFPFRYVYGKNKLYFKLRKLFKFVIDRSDLVVLLSEKYFDDFLSLSLGDVSKLRCIPNPLVYTNEEAFNLIKKKQILYVDRFNLSEKRPDRLLKIWKKLYHKYPDWELVFVGADGIEGYMRRYVKRYNLDRVVFAGQCDPKSYYEQASILCLTSSYEGFPMVLLEAMQNKVVPIAFNSFNSITDIIIDGVTGVLVEPFDLDGYASKLEMLMIKQLERQKMAEHAFEHMANFSKDNVSKLWESTFEELFYK